MKPLPSVLIEPMEGADLDAVAALENDIAEFPWSRGHFSDCLRAGYSAWVLRADAALVGYAVLMMVVDEGHLLNIGVAANYQRRGLGRYLLEHVLMRTRESGGLSLLLEVRPSNHKALALYRRFGFGEIGRRKGYYPAHLGREDALVLRRELDNQA